MSNWWNSWITPEIYILHLRTYGLYLPNLFIHELPVAHSKTTIWWHFVIVFADTLVVKAPHQTERSAKLVEQLDYSRNLHFSFATDGLYLPNLLIHELPVAHSKTSIWWHFVIVYADTLVVKAPHQK